MPVSFLIWWYPNSSPLIFQDAPVYISGWHLHGEGYEWAEATLSGRVRDSGAKEVLKKQLAGLTDSMPEFLDLKTGRLASKKVKKEKTPEEECMANVKKMLKKNLGFHELCWVRSKIFGILMECISNTLTAYHASQVEGCEQWALFVYAGFGRLWGPKLRWAGVSLAPGLRGIQNNSVSCDPHRDFCPDILTFYLTSSLLACCLACFAAIHLIALTRTYCDITYFPTVYFTNIVTF